MLRALCACVVLCGAALAVPAPTHAAGMGEFYGHFTGSIAEPGCSIVGNTQCGSVWTARGFTSRMGMASFQMYRETFLGQPCGDADNYYDQAAMTSMGRGATVTLDVHETSCTPEQGTWVAEAPAAGNGTYTCSYGPTVNGSEPFSCTFMGRLAN